MDKEEFEDTRFQCPSTNVFSEGPSHNYGHPAPLLPSFWIST